MPLISMVIARAFHRPPGPAAKNGPHAPRIARMTPARVARYVMPYGSRGSAKDDRSEARSEPPGLDGGSGEPLPVQRRHRRAHAQADAAGPAGRHGTVDLDVGPRVHR